MVPGLTYSEGSAELSRTDAQAGCQPGLIVFGGSPHRATTRAGTRRGLGGTELALSVIERTYAWLQNYRKVLVRHERLLSTYRAFVVLACVMITLAALLR